MSDHEQRIYNTLENTPRILFWEMDEFLSFVVPVFLSIAFASILWIVLAFFSKYLYCKVKKNTYQGFCIHFLYWHFPKRAFSGRLSAIPPSEKREFLQ